MKLDLKNVTLWACVWTHDAKILERTMRVLCHTMGQCDFAEVILFSCEPVPCEGCWRIVPIPVLDMAGWSRFINFEVPKHIRSEYAMSVHEDGFVLDPGLWTPEFLQYDYIGAPWPDGVVGNGGFNIESKRMLESKRTLPVNGDPSDVFVCRTHRAELERQGLQFAPRSLAARFSTEQTDNDQPSFGFHGRTASPEKYALGWKAIEDLRTIETDLVYLHVAQGKEYEGQAQRFVDTYCLHPPGYSHKTIIACNLGRPNQAMRAIFGRLPNVSYYYHSNAGQDIGAYVSFSKISDAEMMVCFGSHGYLQRAGWLRRFVEVWKTHGPGLYGTLATYEVRPHFCTTGFAFPPELLTGYPHPVRTHDNRYAFEHGPHSFVNWTLAQRLPVRLVTWDGDWPVQAWRQPENIYTRGDQSNCLSLFRCSDSYIAGDENERARRRGLADSLTVPMPV